MSTPSRRTYYPLWLLPAVVSALAVVVFVVLLLARSTDGATVTVPSVVGLDVAVARSRLAEAGLSLTRGDSRFSPSVPLDSVISQDPPPGAVVEPGASITVAISAGSEDFPMPDVVGMNVEQARGILKARGLVVRVDPVPSSEATGTVLGTMPVAGVRVKTSDVVRLTVAAHGEASSVLLPYQLSAMTFVLDPSPVSTTTPDAPLEVARRLQSLLEASGAKVATTRSLTDTDTSAAARLSRAMATSSTAVVALVADSSGQGGFVITTPASSPERVQVHVRSTTFADRIAEELRSPSARVSRSTFQDSILIAVTSPGAHVRLGSAADAADAESFRDPRWADSVARSLYKAIGEVFAPK